ncbi:hypothetical protein B0H11DRAFT_1918648 [Mycena galericulata]|nr:hypothetical protein B0H11DRAFT_1918648 [Mycena galericulata]
MVRTDGISDSANKLEEFDFYVSTSSEEERKIKLFTKQYIATELRMYLIPTGIDYGPITLETGRRQICRGRPFVWLSYPYSKAHSCRWTRPTPIDDDRNLAAAKLRWRNRVHEKSVGRRERRDAAADAFAFDQTPGLSLFRPATQLAFLLVCEIFGGQGDGSWPHAVAIPDPILQTVVEPQLVLWCRRCVDEEGVVGSAIMWGEEKWNGEHQKLGCFKLLWVIGHSRMLRRFWVERFEMTIYEDINTGYSDLFGNYAGLLGRREKLRPGRLKILGER